MGYLYYVFSLHGIFIQATVRGWVADIGPDKIVCA